MQTIYEPKGAAKEYGELALNIYSECTHGCTYCYAPSVLHRDRSDFHQNVTARPGIVNAVKARLAKGDIVDKEIFLCFTCDPFPMGVDHTPTFEIIRAIKESGNHVAILTKGDPDVKLFNLLDGNDRFGVTISCGGWKAASAEPNALNVPHRLLSLFNAKSAGIKTFVSCEPVLESEFIYELIKTADYIDEYRIGKLNYFPSDINWKVFGTVCEELCKEYHRNYMIKDGLQVEMNK
jgi:DNA repair photolyase